MKPVPFLDCGLFCKVLKNRKEFPILIRIISERVGRGPVSLEENAWITEPVATAVSLTVIRVLLTIL